MKKIEVVKSNYEFDSIIHNGKMKKNNEFIIYYKDNSYPYVRFGISVGKKIGNAVTRNYYKRIVRNICDKNKKNYSNSKDYIIIVRKGCIGQSFDALNNCMLSLIKNIEKEKQNENKN